MNDYPMNPDNETRLIIADNHGVVRVGLKQLFSLMNDITVAGEASDGLELLNLLRQHAGIDLLLLDLNLPDIHASGLIARIRAQNKSLPILVFSMYNEPLIAKRVLQMGASGFVTKGCSLETLIVAIRKTAAGGRFVDPDVAESLIFDPPVPSEEAPHHKLSERELHILKLFAQGKTGNEIARMLAISKKTVSTHKTNLMQKMNFQNLAELVLYAATYALIE